MAKMGESVKLFSIMLLKLRWLSKIFLLLSAIIISSACDLSGVQLHGISKREKCMIAACLVGSGILLDQSIINFGVKNTFLGLFTYAALSIAFVNIECIEKLLGKIELPKNSKTRRILRRIADLGDVLEGIFVVGVIGSPIIIAGMILDRLVYYMRC